LFELALDPLEEEPLEAPELEGLDDFGGGGFADVVFLGVVLGTEPGPLNLLRPLGYVFTGSGDILLKPLRNRSVLYKYTGDSNPVDV